MDNDTPRNEQERRQVEVEEKDGGDAAKFSNGQRKPRTKTEIKEGQVFQRLTAIRFLGKKGKNLLWEFKCSCGNLTQCLKSNVLRGVSKSCGCLKDEVVKTINRTHGGRRTDEYNIWTKIKERCFNSSNRAYHWYGERGITMCEEWRNDFAKFLSYVGKRPSKKHSIDRIDNNGNYEPGNVRWATQLEQCNNKRSNHNLTLKGETLSISSWARKFQIHSGTILARLTLGWSIEDSITKPVRKQNQ